MKGVGLVEFYDLDLMSINRAALDVVPKTLCEEYSIFPYDIKGTNLYLTSGKALSMEQVKYLSFLVRKNINHRLGKEEQVTTYINKYYEENYRKTLVSKFNIVSSASLNEKVNEAKGPIVFLIDSIIRDGVFKGASDIHIEPLEDTIRIRYRIDGVLIKSETEIPKLIYDNIVTRIKVMAHMDIASRYESQDGEINTKISGESYDFRVSSLPTIHGEKFVIRILKRTGSLLRLDSLGFKGEDYRLLENILKFKQGLVIITGPTGSGKTSTLYAMIRELNKECRNIITVEKPVECDIEGINQVSIGTKGNLEYGEVLKSALRQDPDIIMVGEIIDKETAEIAIRASLTGHLVLTTLHTNDASSTINRLLDMGIKRELINSSLVMVIAQRLTRIICKECKESYELPKIEKNILKLKASLIQAFKGKGCKKCNHTGYKGRVIAYEIMVIGDKIKESMKSEDNNMIRNTAIESGMVTMEDYFKNLVLQGITTVDEYHINLQVYNIERALGVDYGI